MIMGNIGGHRDENDACRECGWHGNGHSEDCKWYGEDD